MANLPVGSDISCNYWLAPASCGCMHVSGCDECLWHWKQLAKCAGDLERNVIVLIAQEHTHSQKEQELGKIEEVLAEFNAGDMQKLHPQLQEQTSVVVTLTQKRPNSINKALVRPRTHCMSSGSLPCTPHSLALIARPTRRENSCTLN